MTTLNQQVAEAMGWRFHVCVWFDTNGNEHLNLNFETDWTQLPAILAGIFGCDHIDVALVRSHIYGEEVVMQLDDTDIEATGANLLLAAGALLLKLAEQRGKP